MYEEKDNLKVILSIEKIIDDLVDFNAQKEILIESDISEDLEDIICEIFSLVPEDKKIEDKLGKYILKIRKIKKILKNKNLDNSKLLEEAENLKKKVPPQKKKTVSKLAVVSPLQPPQKISKKEIGPSEIPSNGIIMEERSAAKVVRIANQNRKNLNSKKDDSKKDDSNTSSIRKLSADTSSSNNSQDIESRRNERSGGKSTSTRYTTKQAPGYRGVSHVAADVEKISLITNDFSKGDEVLIPLKTIVGITSKNFNIKQGKIIIPDNIPKRVLLRNTRGTIKKIDRDWIYIYTTENESILIDEHRIKNLKLIGEKNG